MRLCAECTVVSLACGALAAPIGIWALPFASMLAGYITHVRGIQLGADVYISDL